MGKYLKNLVVYRSHMKAYMEIDWEKEAFAGQSEPLDAAELAIWARANGDAV